MPWNIGKALMVNYDGWLVLQGPQSQMTDRIKLAGLCKSTIEFWVIYAKIWYNIYRNIKIECIVQTTVQMYHLNTIWFMIKVWVFVGIENFPFSYNGSDMQEHDWLNI